MKKGNAKFYFFLIVIWFLKSSLDLKLLLLIFNVLIILKVILQLREYQENTRRTHSISQMLGVRKY
jgi:hypothetical protein